MKKLVLMYFLAGIVLLHAINTTAIRPLNNLSVTDRQITDHPFAEYPDVSVDKQNRSWVVYTQLKDGKESIRCNVFNQTENIASFQVSNESGKEFRPKITCAPNGRIWIVWSAVRGGNRDIYARSFGNDFAPGPEIRASFHRSADINPDICIGTDNKILIVWESVRNGNFDILFSRIENGTSSKPAALSHNSCHDFRPVCIADQHNNFHLAWDRQVGNSYRIMLCRMNENNISTPVCVSDTIAYNMSPAIALDQRNRPVLAWHSNLQPNGTVGLTPWIHIKYPGRNAKPVTAAKRGDWQKQGENQGMEFPEICFDKKNRLWVFSHPSQGFFAQCFNKRRAGNIYRFDVPGWGGRGQFVRADTDENGNMITVRRDIRHLYLASFNPEEHPLNFPNRCIEINIQDKEIKSEFSSQHADSHTLRHGDKILFGDIHQHSSMSDGCGTIDQCYTRSRYEYQQDFAALSDHEWFVGNLLMPSEWDWIKLVGKTMSEAGKFTAIPAYEWTTPRYPKGFGHKNVYFNHFDSDIFSWYFNKKDSRALFNFVKSQGAFAVPHHIGWTGTDWENHIASAEPVVEIVSAHGAFEYMGNEPITHRGGIPGSFVRNALDKNRRFALIGSSDGHGLHSHHGVGRKDIEWESGLAAVLCRKNTLPALWEALSMGHCYATSGSKIKIDFRINGHKMGDDINLREPPSISLEVIGTDPLHYVSLIRDGKPILMLGKDIHQGRGVRKTYIDRSATVGSHYYYLRILQENGEMAWSTPIWIHLEIQ